MERMRKSTIGGGGGQFDDNYWSYSKSCIKHPLTVSLTDPQIEEIVGYGKSIVIKIFYFLPSNTSISIHKKQILLFDLYVFIRLATSSNVSCYMYTNLI